jgi:hypothetical protein
MWQPQQGSAERKRASTRLLLLSALVLVSVSSLVAFEVGASGGFLKIAYSNLRMHRSCPGPSDTLHAPCWTWLAAAREQQAALSLSSPHRGAVAPSRIPATTHQVLGMYDSWTRPRSWAAPKDLDLPFLSSEVRACMQSWVDMNPGWQYRVWDRQDVEVLLREQYPQYLTAWATLPKDVERSDFARWALCSAWPAGRAPLSAPPPPLPASLRCCLCWPQQP